jgi:hypothetical protein
MGVGVRTPPGVPEYPYQWSNSVLRRPYACHMTLVMLKPARSLPTTWSTWALCAQSRVSLLPVGLTYPILRGVSSASAGAPGPPAAACPGPARPEAQRGISASAPVGLPPRSARPPGRGAPADGPWGSPAGCAPCGSGRCNPSGSVAQ